MRRRLTKLKIDEISSVDRPAQAGALAVIMKRFEGGAGEQFDAKVAEIQKRDGCKHYQAMERARIEHPDLFAAWA